MSALQDLYAATVEPFVAYDFMRRALVGCLGLSLGSVPVGVFLMLRRMSLTGDAMAHAILPGAAVGFLVAGFSLGAMTIGGIAAGLVVALASGLVARSTILKEDTTLAAFYLTSLAVGVLIVSRYGSNVDLLHVLFGAVLALDDVALLTIGGIATASMLTLALIWRPLVLECLDPGFLRSTSHAGAPTHFVFLALVVVNLVAGFQALGTLLAVGVMILPAATARFWAADLGPMVVFGVLFGYAACVLGLVASWNFNLASGPAIIVAASAFYVASMLFGPQGSVLSRLRLRPGRHRTA